jgi:hypothetical protein
MALGGAAALAQPPAPGAATEPGDVPEFLTDETPAVENLPAARRAERRSPYWIGLAGTPITDPVLRAQLQLPADAGVAIDEVVPESPAAEAGLRRHDIVLRVGAEPVRGMADLQQAVAGSGGEPLPLTIVRVGQEIDLLVVPRPRPAGTRRPAPQAGADQDPAAPGQLLRRGPRGGPLRRGAAGGAAGQIAAFPSGVSVQLQRRHDQPVQITVSRGGETWVVRGDDPESLERLPEDLRPAVEGLLEGSSGLPMRGERMGPGWRPFREPLPDWLGEGEEQAERAAREKAEAVKERMQQRLEQLERRFEELQQQLDRRLPQGGEAPQPEGSPEAVDPSST